MEGTGHETSAPAGATALPARGGFRIDRGVKRELIRL
jgi:hypothetical protein